MRRFAALGAALAVVMAGLPVPATAEGMAGTVSGDVVDAVGRPLSGIAVELMRASAGLPVWTPLATTVTDHRGAWSVATVDPGRYVV